MGSRPASLDPLEKRGGALSITSSVLEPSSIPTSPPQSRFRHGVPKINGSTGAFIGLVVGLILFILLCCGAALYLLRARQRRTPGSSRNGGSVTRFFSSRRKKNAGWIQQTDEFNYESADEEEFMGPVFSSRNYAEGGQGYSGRVGDDGYADPFDPEKLPESVHRQQIPLPTRPSRSIPAPIPTISSASTDLPRGYTAADITPKHSPTSPTFEGGTKFKEQFY